jgi:anti-sigma B factor antagonist
VSTNPFTGDAPVIGLEVSGPDTEPTLRIEGEIDVATAPLLRESLLALVDGGARRINLDLAAVGFVDSSGLGVLVGALRKLEDNNGGRLRVENVQDGVRKVFEITGLGPMFGLAPR